MKNSDITQIPENQRVQNHRDFLIVKQRYQSYSLWKILSSSCGSQPWLHTGTNLGLPIPWFMIYLLISFLGARGRERENRYWEANSSNHLTVSPTVALHHLPMGFLNVPNSPLNPDPEGRPSIASIFCNKISPLNVQKWYQRIKVYFIKSPSYLAPRYDGFIYLP